MGKLTIIDRSAVERQIEGQFGLSLMEVIRNSHIDELQAVCGGSCACATCHVYADPSYWAALPKPSEIEDELLSCSLHRTQYSRLSCQVPFTSALEGVRVVIAPED